MNQLFAGGIALLIALAVWTTGKKSQLNPLKFNQKDFVSDQSKEEISLVQPQKLVSGQIHSKETSELIDFISPKTSRDRLILKKELLKLITGSPEDRLFAVKKANKWEHKESIAIIRRGLRDSDSRVVIAAAAAISKYKGKESTKASKGQTGRPPRNVALMR